MIQNTAILLKVSGVIVAIGATTGAGYFAHTQGVFVGEKEMLENESVTQYLIVKSVALNKEEERGGFFMKKEFFQILQKNSFVL